MIDNKKLLLKSAAHWRKDILEPLKAGRKIALDLNSFLVWANDGVYEAEVYCYGDSCPLCEVYDIFGDCYILWRDKKIEICPIKKHTSTGCGVGDNPWYNFFKEPTIENAQAMVDLLEKLADEY